MKRKKLVLTLIVLAITSILATPIVMSYLIGNSAGTVSEFVETSGLSLVDGSSWTTTQVISTESTNTASNPSLAVGLDGTIHVAWQDGTTLPPDADGTWDIFYKKYVLGTGWTTTQVVSTESTDTAMEPSLAVGSDGTVHVAWYDSTTLPPDADGNADIFYKKYVPGTGWTTTQVISTESTNDALNPSLAVGPDGTVHVAWYDSTTLPPDTDIFLDIFYKKYVPGTGWTTTQVISTESTNHAWYPSLAVGPNGTVHVAWYDSTPLPDSDGYPDIFYKKYVPGTGWTTTQVVSTESITDALNPSLAVGSDGTVHVVWYDSSTLPPDADGGYTDIFYKKYVPGTGWTTTQVISTESTNHARYPSLAVGPDGTVHTAWYDYTTLPPDPDPDPDIFYKKYVPGTGWTTTQVISTESTNTATFPSLAIGLDGTVHVAWCDYTTLPPDADATSDILYKKNVLSPVEPANLSDLITPPVLTHLVDLSGTEKTSKYTDIQTTVEGYTQVKNLLESRGYTFTGDYNISTVEGTINEQLFSGSLYSHWSSLNTTTGTRALLSAAKMDDGIDMMFGVVTNLLPSQLRPPAGYIITNAMPYMYVEFHLWDKANSRIASWSNWWYESNSNPDWFWTVYYWWRIYTKQYYSWYYYQPWWYIWHWLYWKHWNLWTTQA